MSWDLSGPVGGPFTNTSIDVKLGNRDHASLDWSSTAPSFVQLSPSSGTIPARTRIPLTGTIDTSAANALAAGRYTGSLVFHNQTSNEQDIVVPVTLVVNSPTLSGSVSPATDFNSQGPAGGPFSPDSVVYTLTNTGTVDLPWRVTTADNWVGASPGSGTVAVGGSVNIAVSIQDAATASFSNGVHPSSITFAETSGGTTIATRNVGLNIQAGQASTGWTIFTPSADTRVVYVSSSSGNDSNDGYSQNTPKRTLAAARATMRNGYPDWMLLKSGDVWNENFGSGWGLNGRSSTERMLVSSYGSGPRPTLQSGTGNCISVWGNGDGNNLAFVGLHLWPNTYDGINGSPRCLCVFGSVSNLLVEDCYMQAAETNIVIQGASESPGPTGRHQNIALRRNVIVDAFSTGTANSQGMFISGTDNLLVEENVIDHNGWRDDVPGSGPTWYRHNVYLQNLNTGVVFRGNIVASTDGLQARAGGDIEENLMLHNAINIILGGGGFPEIETNGVAVTARHNVVLDGNDLQAGSPRGWGMHQSNIRQGTVEYNVIAHNVSGHGPVPVIFDVANDGIGVHDTSWNNNIIYNWAGVSTVNGDSSTVFNIQFQSNKFQNHVTAEPLLNNQNQSSTSTFYSSNNVFDTSAPSNACMAIGGGDVSLATWKPLVHDTTSVEQSAAFPDPNRTIATYQTSIGGAPSLVDFMTQARLQSKAYWRDQYTAKAVNDYIRAGFGL